MCTSIYVYMTYSTPGDVNRGDQAPHPAVVGHHAQAASFSLCLGTQPLWGSWAWLLYSRAAMWLGRTIPLCSGTKPYAAKQPGWNSDGFVYHGYQSNQIFRFWRGYYHWPSLASVFTLALSSYNARTPVVNVITLTPGFAAMLILPVRSYCAAIRAFSKCKWLSPDLAVVDWSLWSTSNIK